MLGGVCAAEEALAGFGVFCLMIGCFVGGVGFFRVGMVPYFYIMDVLVFFEAELDICGSSFNGVFEEV